MRIGMLTGGGDCPGLNPVIRAVCRRLWEGGHETFGVLNGWRGMCRRWTACAVTDALIS